MSTIKVRLKIFFFQPNERGSWDTEEMSGEMREEKSRDYEISQGYLWKDIELPFPCIPRPGEIIAMSIVDGSPSDDLSEKWSNFIVSKHQQIVYTREYVVIPVYPSCWIYGDYYGIHMKEDNCDIWMDLDADVVSDWNVHMGSTEENLEGLTREQLLEKAFTIMREWDHRQFDWELQRRTLPECK
jgi:hypothetical protein